MGWKITVEELGTVSAAARGFHRWLREKNLTIPLVLTNSNEAEVHEAFMAILVALAADPTLGPKRKRFFKILNHRRHEYDARRLEAEATYKKFASEPTESK